MRSDRNTPKPDTFREPTAYQPKVQTSSEQIINFARHEYGRVGDLVKMKVLVQKLQPSEKCYFQTVLIKLHHTVD